MSSRLSGIFTEAIAIADLKEQEAFLKKSCKDDPELLEQVRKLVNASNEARDSIFRPFAVLPKENSSSKETIELELPKMFGGYRLEEKIGEGGMGIIYRAIQVDLQRVVALKMIRDAHLATKTEIKRFNVEARSAAALSHPGIVPVIESGRIDEQYFFSMGYIDGIDLARLVKEFPLTIAQAINIIKEIATATHYAHKKGVVHRDLKPENILISYRDSPFNSPDCFQPHITDFGLAKRQAYDPGLTMSGEILGTPGYMSPEQAGSGPKVTEATDVYAIGALFYFLLTERAPFEGDSLLDTLGAVRNTHPTPPKSLRPFIPDDLEAVCLKCLEKDPQNRYESADDICTDLENHQNGRPLIAKPGGVLNRFSKFCKRNPILTFSTLAGGALVAALVFFQLKLRLSDEKLAQENATTQSALERAKQQSVDRELTKAAQSVSTGNHRQAIVEFLNTAEMAREMGDDQAETSARWGLSDSLSRLWHIKGQISALPGIQKMTLSPDGKYLAAISLSEGDANSPKKYGLEIYDVDSGTLLFHELSGLEFTDLCFHPSGNNLAVSTEIETIKIIGKSGQKFKTIKSIEERVKAIKSAKPHSIGYFDKGHSIFTSGLAPRIGIWKHDTNPSYQGFFQAEDDLAATAISGDFSLIVSHTMNDKIYGWDPVSKETVFGPIEIKFAPIPFESQIVVNQQGSRVAISSEKKNNIAIYNVSTWSSKNSPDGGSQIIENKAPLQMQFGNKTDSLFYLSKTGTLRVKKNSIEPDIAIPISRKDVESFVVSDDESFLVTAHSNPSELIIWQACSFWNNEFTLPKSFHGRVHSTGSDQPIMISGKTHVRVFPGPRELLDSNTPPAEIRNHFISGNPLQILGSRTSNWAIGLGENGERFDITVTKRTQDYSAWNPPVPFRNPEEIFFSPDDNFVICYTSNLPDDKTSNVAILDIQANEHKENPKMDSHTIPSVSIQAASVSSLHNEEVVFASQLGKLVWFDLSKREIKKEVSTGHHNITSLTTNRDLGTLALGLESGKIHLYKEESMTLQGTFNHDDVVSLLSFGNKGQLLVAGGHENHVTIWEAASGLTIGNKLIHQGKIVDLDVCDDSQSIITATAGGQVKVWPLPTKDDRNLEKIREDARKLFLISE